MAVSRMLKMQILGHVSRKKAVKRLLLETGTIQVTEAAFDGERAEFDWEDVRRLEGLLDQVNGILFFLEPYAPKESFFARIGKGPIESETAAVERLIDELDIERTWLRCNELQGLIRGARDDVQRGQELVRQLRPWIAMTVPLEKLDTARYATQLWVLPDAVAGGIRSTVEERFPDVHFEEIGSDGGRRYTAVIVSKEAGEGVAETLKELGGFRSVFERNGGTPAEIIEGEMRRWKELEREAAEAEEGARELAGIREKLLLVSDHLRDRIELSSVEHRFHRTESTFVVEGWIRALDRKRIEQHLRRRFDEIEVSFRPPADDEEPPICLDNGPASNPYEFVTTLYGRPIYREVDPTPLLAPFFILFFALCLTDAGYGITLAILSGLILWRFRPSGGVGQLMWILFMGGVVTAVIGVIAGGIFGINAASLPPMLQRFVLINPLQEPMKMLNISFLMGLVHMLFGMGIKMAANIRAKIYTDAVFDQLFWMLFLLALAPLGFSAILGGEVPEPVMAIAKWVSLAVAALIFLTGGRKQKSVVGKFFKGLVGFYDVVGYFGDVLSYARLLALGLATSAIAIAVNDIAAMVKGLPFFTGYVLMVLILVGGHAFNIAVNTLGAFVHSGRLQYLEFFSKFFTGGGKEFQPFASKRRYSVIRESNEQAVNS